MPEKCLSQVMIKLLSRVIKCSLEKSMLEKSFQIVRSVIKINNKKHVIMENFDREMIDHFEIAASASWH